MPCQTWNLQLCCNLPQVSGLKISDPSSQQWNHALSLSLSLLLSLCVCHRLGSDKEAYVLLMEFVPLFRGFEVFGQVGFCSAGLHR